MQFHVDRTEDGRHTVVEGEVPRCEQRGFATGIGGEGAICNDGGCDGGTSRAGDGRLYLIEAADAQPHPRDLAGIE